MQNNIKKISPVDYFRSALATSTFRQSSITFLGTLLNGGLGALFYILSARFLGPESFGLMMVAITTLTLVGDVGDLGTNTGIVRFAGEYAFKERERSFRYLKLGLKIKVLVSILVVLLGFILAPFIAVNILSKGSLVLPLRITFFGVGSYLLFSFIISSLQAYQRFWSWSIIQVSTNSLRLITLLILIYLSSLTLNNNLISYAVIPFLGFLVGLLLLPGGFLKVTKDSEVLKDFFHYNKWVAIFTLLAAIGGRLDIYISARLLKASELGIYSAATQLVAVVPQIVGAINTVVAPKMASMGTLDALVRYMKKTQVLVLGVALMGVLSIPFVIWIIPVLFGVEYISTVPLFVVLLFAMLLFLISVPIHMSVFYYFSYPQLFVWLSLAHVLLMLILGWNLITAYGAMGAAITVLVGQVFNFVIPLIWVLRKIRMVR